MKARYKFLIVVVIIGLGMMNEGAHLSSGQNQQNPSNNLQQEIRNYENIIAAGGEYRSGSNQSRHSSGDSTQYDYEYLQRSNFFSRLGRNVGQIIQFSVREVLRRFAYFFNRMIS